MSTVTEKYFLNVKNKKCKKLRKDRIWSKKMEKRQVSNIRNKRRHNCQYRWSCNFTAEYYIRIYSNGLENLDEYFLRKQLKLRI